MPKKKTWEEEKLTIARESLRELARDDEKTAAAGQALTEALRKTNTSTAVAVRAMGLLLGLKAANTDEGFDVEERAILRAAMLELFAECLESGYRLRKSQMAKGGAK